MRSLISNLLVILSVILSPAVFAKSSDHELAVRGAFDQWIDALEHHNSEVVVNLYREDAILLATLENDPLTTQQQRKEYFDVLIEKPDFHAKADLISSIRVNEDTATLSGLYTFRYGPEDAITELPARFLFVYEKKGEDWMIVEHHSSQMPHSS